MSESDWVSKCVTLNMKMSKTNDSVNASPGSDVGGSVSCKHENKMSEFPGVKTVLLQIAERYSDKQCRHTSNACCITAHTSTACLNITSLISYWLFMLHFIGCRISLVTYIMSKLLYFLLYKFLRIRTAQLPIILKCNWKGMLCSD